MRKSTRSEQRMTIGIDLGDRMSRFCVVDPRGSIDQEDRVATTPAALRKRFASRAPAVIAIEAGTHSPWVNRLLTELGHEVLVANPEKLRVIYENHNKSDVIDARYLARLARFDRQLLHPIVHRSEQAQTDLALLRSRDILVRTRTSLITHVRGMVKSFGMRIASGKVGTFPERAKETLPPSLHDSLATVIDSIADLTTRIHKLDRAIEELIETRHPEAELVRQVSGVGAIVGLTFVLTIEDPDRFEKSRQVGPFLGLVPARDQSGGSDPQRRITRRGDAFLRRLLVQSAQYILGPFGPDSDLRRFGERICERGGKNARRRAVVAVARKLATVLHRLWKTGQVYEPLRTQPTTLPPAAHHPTRRRVA